MIKARLAALSFALIGSQALAQPVEFPFFGANNASGYQVTITNITQAQTFTPQLIVTHPQSASLFQLGEPASPELENLAEGGATGPLTDAVVNVAEDVQTIGGLLGPGESATATIRSRGNTRFFSMAAMLLPTNDTFVGVDSLRRPPQGTVTYFARAYDAGTEANDQLCANIPGPLCDGEPGSAPADDDEGFVHVSNGFHDLGGEALSPATYDWRNPVARVVVTRIR